MACMLLLHVVPIALDNGLALTPPLGWRSYLSLIHI